MSKTYVALSDEDPDKILGFVTLAIRVMTPKEELPAEMQKRLPRSVPGYTLARLAIDKTAQGQGLGEYLLLDAMERAFRAADAVGGYTLFVDAKDGAGSFYQKYGFVPFLDDPDTLVLPFSSMPDFSELGHE